MRLLLTEIACRRGISGPSDPHTGFTGAPRTDLKDPDAQRSPTVACPRAQHHPPPLATDAIDSAPCSNPTQPLGEHRVDLLSLLALDVVDLSAH